MLQTAEGESFYLIANAHFEPLTFRLPGEEGTRWTTVIDTADPESRQAAGAERKAEARSLVVLRRE
jgi:glycogen operon protein